MDELLATDLELLWPLTRILSDQFYNVIVIDEGRSEQDELEVKLLDIAVDQPTVRSRLVSLVLQAPGRFKVGAAKGS